MDVILLRKKKFDLKVKGKYVCPLFFASLYDISQNPLQDLVTDSEDPIVEVQASTINVYLHNHYIILSRMCK